jgi:hypothetical protein
MIVGSTLSQLSRLCVVIYLSSVQFHPYECYVIYELSLNVIVN